MLGTHLMVINQEQGEGRKDTESQRETKTETILLVIIVICSFSYFLNPYPIGWCYLHSGELSLSLCKPLRK